MTAKTKEQIIEDAMNDKSIYQEMAKKEGAFWGALLGDPVRNERVVQAQTAAIELKKNRYLISLIGYVREHGLKLENGLLLGCGNGRAERAYLAQGVCETFHSIDISEEAVNEGRRIAAEQNLPITYEVADLNFIEFPAEKYDFICALTSLHHVLHLEHLIENTWKTLKPGGIFWVHDFIGETQFQWSDDRIEITNTIVELLPEKNTYDKVNKRKMPKLTRPVPGTLGSPFESIRSGDIAPILLKWFNVEKEYKWGSILHHVTPPGVLESYLENEDTKAMHELLLYFDGLLIKHNVLPPTGVQYVLTAKPRDQVDI